MGFVRMDHGEVYGEVHGEVQDKDHDEVCHGKYLEHQCSLADELDMLSV